MADEDFDFTLLGDIVVKPATAESEDPVQVCSGKGTILYFGAHWSEPCSKFLPKLHFFHELNQKVKEDYQIIFCSLDKSEEDYNSYIEAMPWWCLPYAISTLPKLVASLQASRMPHLVVIDMEGKIITKEGANALKQDPTGKHFPWRPKRIVDMLPNSYRSGELSSDDENVLLSTDDLDEKYILLYFASHLDALSQEFTPWLVKAYNILKNKRKDFELIFVSGDASEANYDVFLKEAPICAIPFEETEAREGLEMRLDITSYPTLIMLGPRPEDDDDNFGDRPVINSEVRAVIENGDYITDFPFYPKPWGDLCKTTDDINTHKCLVVFHEGGDEDEQMEVEYAVRDAAEEYRSGDELVKFYWACDPNAILSANIRKACNLGPIADLPSMVLLDIPNDGTYYVSDERDITEDTIIDFLGNYKNCAQGNI
jgi:nucleoredoxin